MVNTKIKIEEIGFLMEMVYFIYMKNILIEKIKNKFLSLESSENDIIDKLKKDIPPFKYQNLKDQIETYQLSNTNFDITIHKIDDFMVEVYRTMCNFETIVDYGFKEINEIDEFCNTIQKDYLKIKKFFKNIMLNYDFEETEIRSIQKNYLQYEMLKETVNDENYETSAIIRDKVKTL